MTSWTTVLKLATLRVEVRPRPSYFDRWLDCHVIVQALPFAGLLETIVTDEDLIAFAASLERLDPEGEAVLGGDRAAELRLNIGHQIGGTPGSLALECSLTPSADDPYPYLRWLIFSVQPFTGPTSRLLREIASLDPWPSP